MPQVTGYNWPVYNWNTGKAINTEYQNGGRMRIVLISIHCQVTIATDRAYASLSRKISSPTSPVSQTEKCGIYSSPDALDAWFEVVGIIPPGWYYELWPFIAGGGAVTVDRWAEVDI